MVPEGHQKDWPKLKKQSSWSIGLTQSPVNSPFSLESDRQVSLSWFILLFGTTLYRDTFSIEEETVLNEPSQKAVTRQFLRGIPQAISSKLQLDYATESYTNLAK